MKRWTRQASLLLFILRIEILERISHADTCAEIRLCIRRNTGFKYRMRSGIKWCSDRHRRFTVEGSRSRWHHHHVTGFNLWLWGDSDGRCSSRIGFFTIVINFVFSELKWLLSVLICWLLSATRFWVLVNCWCVWVTSCDRLSICSCAWADSCARLCICLSYWVLSFCCCAATSVVSAFIFCPCSVAVRWLASFWAASLALIISW